ncbi:hypothetical protein GQ600_12576 [Phytophthora cactorum]|nr:hypothetical protein GQ600_12576 [Phytophthora cactorum]
MAEVPGGDKASNHISSNPFDAHTSDRDPFPSFMAALADEQSIEETEEQGIGSVLDWSIDTLAELKPVAFSPLPHQKDAANTSRSPHGASGFFEDEKQYEVLRTPLPAVQPPGEAASDATRNMTTLTPSPAPPMGLHRRRRETMARCEAALREKRGNMNKLQAVLPPPTPKRSPHWRSAHQSATPPSRSTPPRPAKRNRVSTAVTPLSEVKSPVMRPPKWSASPIGIVGSRQPLCAAPATLHSDAMAPSPLVHSPRNTTPKQSSKLRLSFGLSPITFPSPVMEEEKIEDKPSNEDTLPLSSTGASEFDKENGDQQAQMEGYGRWEVGSSSSHGTSSPARMRTPAAKKSVAPALSSMPRRRQQAFIEAMEAEARSSETCSKRSSLLSLYHEAKRLGQDKEKHTHKR